jgi:hypothetical protein
MDCPTAPQFNPSMSFADGLMEIMGDISKGACLRQFIK